MGEIEVIRYLLDEIEEEEAKFRKYRAQEDIARKKAEEQEVHYWWRFVKWEGNMPTKSLIDQNKKKIRKLALKI